MAAIAPSAAASTATCRTAHDLFGNDWRLTDDGGLEVKAAGSAAEWAAAEPPACSSHTLVADQAGFVWAAGAFTLCRLNPRAVGCPGATDPNRWDSWTLSDIDPDRFPAGAEKATIVGLAPATPHFPTAATVVATLSTGERCWLGVPEPTSTTLTLSPEPAPSSHWALHPSRLPVGNHDHFVCEAAGKLWVAGGLTHSRGYPAKLHVFNELFFFDLAGLDSGGQWGSVPMPVQRAYNGLAALDEQVYVLGGSEPQDPEQAERIPQASAFVYDIPSASWAEAPPLPQRRMDCTAASVSGRVYCIGGATWEEGGPNEGPTLSSVVSYTPGESAWREEPALPCPVRQCCSCVIEDRIYVSGNFKTEVGEPLSLLCFEPASGLWSTLPPHPTTPSAALIGAHNGEVWVMGVSKQQATHVYSPVTGAWRREENLPTDQSWGAAWSCTLGDRAEPQLLVVGGAHGDAAAGSYVFDDRVFVWRD